MRQIKCVSRCHLLAAVLMLSTAASTAVPKQRLLCTVELTGAQEVPSVATEAGGTATFTQYDDFVGDSVVGVSVEHTVVNPAYLRIISGAPGENGNDIVHFSGNAESPIRLMLTPNEYLVLIQSPHYLEIVSPEHPEGEIRGDMVNCSEDIGTQCDDPDELAQNLLRNFHWNNIFGAGLTLDEIPIELPCFTNEQFEQWDRNGDARLTRWELARIAYPGPLQRALALPWFFIRGIAEMIIGLLGLLLMAFSG